MSAMARPLAMPAIVPVSATVGHTESSGMGAHPQLPATPPSPGHTHLRCSRCCRCCHWHLQRHNPSISALHLPALCSPCSEGGDTRDKGGRAALAWGGQMPPWAAAFLLPHTPLGCWFLLLRAVKLLLSLCVCMGGVWGDPLHGTPLPVNDNYPHPHLLHHHCSVPREHLQGCHSVTQHMGAITGR